MFNWSAVRSHLSNKAGFPTHAKKVYLYSAVYRLQILFCLEESMNQFVLQHLDKKML